MAQQSAQPVASTEHIPAREHGRGFPPFDSHSFPSQLLWLALTFIALYLLMARVALPRIGSIVEGRRQHIADDLAQAQAFKTESDAALAAHEKALNEARNRAQTLADETRAKASAEAEARRREVDAKLTAHVSEAEKRIAATRSAAMSSVRGIAAEAASAIVERLIGAKPGQQEIDKAINAAVKQ
jgi:F-type H+-transporting ATPase subunit b